MYPLLRELLSDRKGGEVFRCFGIWHWCYIAVVLTVTGALALFLWGKDQGCRKRVLDRCIGTAFGLYILDFFLMPFAYGSIDIEKLPFHVCTAMCVMCFWSHNSTALGSCRIHFALLGFLSNLVYLLYPAGVMWHQAHPLSYRVVQTLSFHGIMVIYGFLMLLYGGEKRERKHMRRDLAVIVGQTCWAMLGNWLFAGFERSFNWFFVMQDPFYILPQSIAPYIMPVVNVLLFFGAEMLIIGIYMAIEKRIIAGKIT